MFNEEVKRRRCELGLTVAQLATRAGLSESYVRAVEAGRRDPSLTTMQALAWALDVPLSEMLGVPPLSEQAVEVARMVDKAPVEVREGLLKMMRAVVRKE